MMAKSKAKAVESDLRCFVNPYRKEPSNKGFVICPELKVKLKEVIGHNLCKLAGQSSSDQSVYTGVAGIALLHLHSAYRLYPDDPARHTQCLKDALHMLEPCLRKLKTHRPTFLCGAGGPLAIAAYIYHLLGQSSMSQECVTKLKDLHSSVSPALPYELLYGHVGYLYAFLFVSDTLPGSLDEALIEHEVSVILDAGQQGSRLHDIPSPLVFTWHDKVYLGAAHGLTGILTVLLQVRIERLKDRINTLVQPCVDYLLSMCLPSGNLPSSLESRGHDRLVHWCHGAPGFVHLLAIAYKVFGDKKYLDGALRCGEVVWEKGLLRKGYGLCHGAAGNAYTFLQLYKLTGQDHQLYRAAKFGEWCLSSDQQCPIADHPNSLFEGLAGTTYFYCDLLAPEKATFPALELLSNC